MGNENKVQLPKENQSENQIVPLQIYVIGESFVGKTCLARTYESGVFEENTCLRNGISRHIRGLKVQNIDTELFIWNVSGQFRRNIVLKHVLFCFTFFVSRAEGVLLLYDVASARSFGQLPIFLEIMRESNPEAIIFIIGARSDLLDKKEVSRETGQKFASSENLEFFECSAKTGENVNEVFEHMARKLLQKKGLILPDKEEILVEGKSIKWNDENHIPNTAVVEEELIFYGSSKEEIFNNYKKPLQDNGSGMQFLNLDQRLDTLVIAPSAEGKNSQSGNEGCHALAEKDEHAFLQSNTNKSSELNEICHSLNDKKDVLLKTEKVVLSEEDMLLEGKCPAWFN